MPIRAPVVFPLWPIVVTTDGPKCGCNDPECQQIGKHPAAKWRDLAFGDPVARPLHGAGYGIKTGAAPKGSDVFVVDIDNEDAADSFEELCRINSEDAHVVHGEEEAWPGTLSAQTGRGYHLFFKHPGFPVKNSRSLLARGIDIKGDGGMVVGAGSPHKSGRTYEWVDASDTPEPAPQWLLDWLRQQAAMSPAPEIAAFTTDLDLDDPEAIHRAELFKQDCQSFPPSVEGQGGDARLFDIVQRGAYDYALPVEIVLETIREHFDPRCSPPWGNSLSERVIHKARDAKTKSTRPRFEPPPAEIAGLFSGAPSQAAAGVAPTQGAAAGPAAAPSVGFVFVPASELTQPLAPVVYVVKHFGVSKGRPTLLAGYGGLGKTIIAQSLALHMSAGREFCWNTSIVPGKVLHFDYEMTRDPLQRRYQRLAVGHGIDLAECDLSLCTMPDIYLSDERAELALCQASEGVTLAVIDNLAAACATGNIGENEAGIRRYLDTLTRVSSKTGCAFIVLAHERKTSKEEASSGIQKVRGSSAITDACGSVISIKSSKQTGIITLEQTKSSLRKQGDELSLEFIDFVGDGLQGKEGEDAPGLIVQRVNNTERDKQEEEKAKKQEQDKLNSVKKEILEHLDKCRERGAKGASKRDVLRTGIVTGASEKKATAYAQLKSDNLIFEFSEGKEIMFRRPL